jgi:hypothetical protein
LAEEQAQARRGGGGLSKFVLWLAVLALLAAVWWLASERNQRRFSWATDDGKLVISKGRFFPIGAGVIASDDPKWGKIYGPIPIPPGAKASEEEFEDQTALDRALFDLVVPWAKADLKAADATAVARAGALVDRADALPGLTAGQHQELAGLRSELSFTAAKDELARAAKLVVDARRKLEAVRESGGDHALEAAPLARELEGVQDALEEASQGKAHGVYAPTPGQQRTAQAAQPSGEAAQQKAAQSPQPSASAAPPPSAAPAPQAAQPQSSPGPDAGAR